MREILLLQTRVLKRIDLTARTFYAMIEPGSAFAGSLFELALAADRSYMLADVRRDATDDRALAVERRAPPDELGPVAARRRGSSAKTSVSRRFSRTRAHSVAEEALEAGLVTFAPDDIDWDDEVRLAIEERAAMSPDALTGMEASLRFVGPETLETKIFGRLSAWQNWIFTRPNATGEKGALTLYGKAGQRPEFDWRRT